MNELIKQLREFASTANELNKALTEKFIADLLGKDEENKKLEEINKKLNDALNL